MPSPVLLAVAEKGDAEVVPGKAFETSGRIELLQNGYGLTELPARHERLRPQEGDVVADLLRHGSLDALQRGEGVQRLLLVEVDLRQPVPGLVAHRLFDVPLDDRRDRPPGPTVHAVGQFEISDGELGLTDVAVEGVELRLIEAVVLRQLGVEPGNGLEPLPLIGVVQGLAEIEVLQFSRRLGTGRRGRCREQRG